MRQGSGVGVRKEPVLSLSKEPAPGLPKGAWSAAWPGRTGGGEWESNPPGSDAPPQRF